MDFAWTELQESLFARTTAFARGALGKGARRGDFARDAWSACGRFGLLGLSVPEALGGMGLDARTTARVQQAFGRECLDAGLLFSAGAHLFAGVMPIVEHASPALAQEIVPPLARGERVAANAITEAEAGSDLSQIRTRAVREGDAYVLDGTKSFVTNAPVADEIVVYASTSPGDGYMGLSAFVVPRECEGVTIGERFETMGLRAAPIASVYLDGARIPSTRRLGGEGEGAAIFQASMRWERSCLFAGFLGIAERVLAKTITHAVSRRQGPRAIGKNQAISHRLVDLQLRLSAAELLLYRACWLIDRGDEAATAIALAKLAISEAALDVGLAAIQVHGGAGYVVESGIEEALRDAIPLTIFSGTSEVQRNLVAAKLGL